ncbi:MAG: SUMF1/EgtB/PvdO family nonheme iron enzyme, partial [Propionibacteriaceae bacterium]|nr:SUMF1/EgtB/PvdO family nonheme iron enzyme [Propionibacteriaceae bacterium]
MAGNGSVAGIAQSGVDGAFTYAVVGPFGSAPPGAASGPDRPITYVTWFDAARFANWMANGQPAGAQDERTTERGAYALDGRVAGDAVARSAINPNTGAPPSYYLPTEDEWYKAAYYSPALERGGGGYHSLATQRDDDPGNVLGDASNQANHINDASGSSIYSVTQEATLDPGQNYLSDVGAFRASASYYGTFDQTGNVWEWTDRDGRSGPYRVIRGGGWTSTPPYLRSSLRLGYVPDRDNSNSGFRLAAPDDGAAPPGCATVDAAVAAPPAIAPPRSADPPPRLPAYGGDVVIELVPVDDAGNVDDRTGFGGVAYAYRIARYEVTIGRYAAFLNAVAASDPHGLYNPRMASDAAIAGIARQGEDGGYTYHVIDNGGDSRDRPITYVSWFDAARFANWLANGQPLGAQDETTTEDGAYALAGAVSGAAVARNAINPNTGAPPAVFLPTEDEWYKAAYYSPLRDAGVGGYFGYATQSDDPPGNRIGDEPNQANYFAGGIFSVTQGSAQEPGQNYLTDVGAFTASASYYGTFDQNGGVWEWNDLDDTPG